MKKGDILLHDKFKFKDGDLGKKLLVILNNPDLKNSDPYLICRTTSVEKGKIKSPACDDNLSTFFIPENSDYFEIDTWIQLHEVFEFTLEESLKDHFDGHLDIRGKLTEDTIRQLLNCIKKIKDISEEHKELINKQ